MVLKVFDFLTTTANGSHEYHIELISAPAIMIHRSKTGLKVLVLKLKFTFKK